MKNLLKIIKENKWVHYALIIIIGIILSIPLKDIQIRDTHDGFFHLLRTLGVNDSLNLNLFPVIIIPDFCNTWGYSMTLFYPPLVTYVPLLFKLISPTYSIALKIFGGACIVLSGITMYNFVYYVTKKRSIAIFSAIIYMISPYKLGNIYIRYAMGEFVALIFLPTLFKGMYSLFNVDGKKHYYIAIGASLLVLSHTITTLYTGLFCIIYILFNYKKLKDKEIIKKLLINFIFIITITMLFYLPMMEAKMHADYAIFSDELMKTTSSYSQEKTLDISEFFFDKGEEYDSIYIIGIPIALLLVFTIYTVRKIDKKYKSIYMVFVLFTIIAAFMCTKYFPWKYMPNFLCKLQYPWRMMGYFNFFTAFICGINIYILISLIKNRELKYVLVIITIILLIIYTLSILSQFKSDDMEKDTKYEEFVLKRNISYMNVNRDYLPIKALSVLDTYLEKRENKTYILNGNANIVSEEKENLVLNLEISDANEGTVLEFPYIYYPGYEVKLIEKDNEIKIKTFESENGFVAMQLPKNIEKCKIEVKFEPTIITKVSYIGSAIAIIAFVIYIHSENKVLNSKNEK